METIQQKKKNFRACGETISCDISSGIYNYCFRSSLLVHEMVNAPVRLNYRLMEGIDDMRFIYASYNSNYNSMDITTFDNILLRIDCNKAEEGISTTPGSQCALNALAIDEPLEYAKLYLDGTMQVWVDAEDSLEL